MIIILSQVRKVVFFVDIGGLALDTGIRKWGQVILAIKFEAIK